MTDRELLLLAAKAAGLSLKSRPEVVDAKGKFIGIKVRHADGEPFMLWNPLFHDGCTLRLAVKLHMQFSIFPGDCAAGAFVNVVAVISDEKIADIYEDYDDDPCAATRRAIVRAAAEIGWDMP